MSRIFLTLLAVVVVIGIALAATGVLHFRNTSDESSVTLDKKELNQKTHEALEKTREAGGKILDKTGQTLHNAADELRGSASDHSASATMPAAGHDDTHQSDRGDNAPGNEDPRPNP